MQNAMTDIIEETWCTLKNAQGGEITFVGVDLKDIV